ncbi:hypothetical protein ACH0B6_19065 [Solibacillus silvestris]
MEMKQSQIPIKVEGVEELKQLLHETLEIAEQLQKNIDRISNCELEIAIGQSEELVLDKTTGLFKSLPENDTTQSLERYKKLIQK